MPKFVTSQNIEIELELASLGERILAFLLDGIIMFFLIIGMSIVVGGTNAGSWTFLFFYIPLMFYSLAFEYLGNGQSPGKRAMNIKVVKLDGSTPDLGSYILRWLFRLIDIYIMYGGVSIISIILTQNGQRLGDIVAGTTVIKIREVGAAQAFRTKATNDHVVQFPAVKMLNDDQIELMKKALKMRRDGFNKEGVEQLAAKLKEKMKVDTDLPDVKFLYAVISDYEFIANQEF
ncbi:MAG: RDD family protein [Cyclobacteriaceae bacterium]